jgi:hypothetical protein
MNAGLPEQRGKIPQAMPGEAKKYKTQIMQEVSESLPNGTSVKLDA